MLYLLDEDHYNAITKTYKCDFIFEEKYRHLIRYYKREEDINFKPEALLKNDVVCFHNSFPNDKTQIISSLKFYNEEHQAYTSIAFSLDSSFYQTKIDKHELRIHKDRFYHNLKSFIDFDYEIDKIIYGEYSDKNEAKVITARILEMIFNYPNENFFDIKTVLPRDLKKLCEIGKFDYNQFLKIAMDTTVGQFKKLIISLNKNI